MRAEVTGIDFDAQTLAWTLRCPQSRYRVNLTGTTLVCDCFAPDNDALPPPHGASVPMVALGRCKQPVTWQLDAWRQTNAETVAITLQGNRCPLVAEIRLTVDPDTGLLVWENTLNNYGAGDHCDITHTLSCWIDVHEPIEQVLYLAGDWAHETQVHSVRPDHAPIVLESRAGKTGFRFQPYVAMSASGAVYLCKLHWSGNWLLHVTPQRDGATVAGGLHDWHFRHGLHPGTSFALPTVLFGRVAGDLNRATQHLHDYRRRHRPDPDRRIAVQFNSWYPKLGELTETDMLELIPIAEQLGCEAFVLDAGWFAPDRSDPVAAWESRTGDWTVSRQPLPSWSGGTQRAMPAGGSLLRPLVRAGSHRTAFNHSLDASRVAASHRQPAAGTPGSRHPPSRDTGSAAIRVRQSFSHSSRGSGRLDEVGLQCRFRSWRLGAGLAAGLVRPGFAGGALSRPVPPAGSDSRSVSQSDPGNVRQWRWTDGWRALLAHAHVNWISDQPGSLHKLAIHFGTQLAHPAVACNDWLVEWPPGRIPGYDDDCRAGDMRGDLAFRLRVAMLGSFGISAGIDRWSAADIATAKVHVGLCTRINCATSSIKGIGTN